MSSIGGLDPLADVYNQLGVQGMFGSNPYLEYQGKIPMAGYQGTPTDASGNPIQSFTDAQAAHDAWNAANPAPATPGTTLNSAPPQQQLQRIYEGQGTGGAAGGENAMGSGGTPGGQMAYGYAMVPQQGILGHPQQQAAAPAAPQNPIDMRQAYLTALANPGHVTTPGAQMLPGTTPTGPQSQPSVLSAFLSQHPGGGTSIPGGYSNQPFFNTLNQLQSQKGASA
jgi:hypothetical protein